MQREQFLTISLQPNQLNIGMLSLYSLLSFLSPSLSLTISGVYPSQSFLFISAPQNTSLPVISALPLSAAIPYTHTLHTVIITT